ncbi:MAG: hypothetical protein ACTHJR_06420 [Sphingomonas sp.]|uniref:hypothetical protein n=1 Tax=Sphingomonas sp. TaxID=28214 RepID=UPI003F7ECD89
MGRIRTLILRCYHYAHHPAALGERPLHLAYFAFVAFESHHIYGYIAAGLFFTTLLATGSKEDTKE